MKATIDIHCLKCRCSGRISEFDGFKWRPIGSIIDFRRLHLVECYGLPRGYDPRYDDENEDAESPPTISEMFDMKITDQDGRPVDPKDPALSEIGVSSYPDKISSESYVVERKGYVPNSFSQFKSFYE